jgi:hypothetical protein
MVGIGEQGFEPRTLEYEELLTAEKGFSVKRFGTAPQC